MSSGRYSTGTQAPITGKLHVRAGRRLDSPCRCSPMLRVLRLHDMARTRAEVAVGERVEHSGSGKGVVEGERHRVVVDLGSVVPLPKVSGEAPLSGVTSDPSRVVPVEHHVLGVERIAVRPFCALDQMHGQRLTVLATIPRLFARFGIGWRSSASTSKSGPVRVRHSNRPMSMPPQP